MVEITKTPDGMIQVASPFHPYFPRKAREMGGRWDAAPKTWRFDARDESRVRELCIEVYGTDGTPQETVTVRYTLQYPDGNDQELFLGGRQVARRPGRDYSVRLGEGVIVVSGGFPGRGGSMKHPCLDGDGTVLEIRDMPKKAADKLLEEFPEQVVVLDDGNKDERRKSLEAEAEALRARLAEIESELASL